MPKFLNDLTIGESVNLSLGTSTGTKIGTSTSQKIGFFNVTPVIQPTNSTDLLTSLVNLGLYQSGGTAIPLNLGTGAVTAGSFSGSGASLTTLNASNLSSGTVPTARLGSGTASSSTYLRGDQTWASISFPVTLPGGTTGNLQYNNAGAFGGTSGLTWDSTNDVLSLTSASLTGTTSFPLLNLAQTWNNASGAFTALKLNVTNTNSAAGSLLLDLQVGGASKFKIDKNGKVYLTSAANSSITDSTNSIFFNRSSGIQIVATPLTTLNNTLDDGSGNALIAGNLIFQTSSGGGGYISNDGDYGVTISDVYGGSWRFNTDGGGFLCNSDAVIYGSTYAYGYFATAYNTLDDGGGNILMGINGSYIQFGDGSQQYSAAGAAPIPDLSTILSISSDAGGYSITNLSSLLTYNNTLDDGIGNMSVAGSTGITINDSNAGLQFSTGASVMSDGSGGLVFNTYGGGGIGQNGLLYLGGNETITTIGGTQLADGAGNMVVAGNLTAENGITFSDSSVQTTAYKVVNKSASELYAALNYGGF